VADGISGSNIVKWIGAPIFGGLIGFVTWLSAGTPYGPALAALFSVIAAVFGLAFALYFDRTVGVLGAGAEPEGSPERQAYDRLRASLAEGNLPERLYAKWLARFLDWVEKYFRDTGMADRTLFPHAFGLKTPAPLWTAPAFDRCLLLALIYPVATIFLIWAISGQIGPAERALGLDPSANIWQRGLAASTLGLSTFAIWKACFTSGWKRAAWSAAVCIGVVLVAVTPVFAVPETAAFTGGGAIAGGYSSTFASRGAAAGVVAGAVCFAVALAAAGNFPMVPIVAISVAIVALTRIDFFPRAIHLRFVLAVGGAFAVAFVVAGAALSTNHIFFALILAFLYAFGFAIAFAFAVTFGCGVSIATSKAVESDRQGIFFVLFLVGMVIASLWSAFFLSSLAGAKSAEPVVLFLGLLTFLNAPFDWLSLGLTRALLRRGLELEGWWPYLLALVDAALAAIVIALLALTMVVGVQAFNELAVHGGGPNAAVLSLDALFDGIDKDPGAPEYWWLYALLLSTMIPSLVNLVIGGMALTRGLPGFGRLLVNFMPAGKAVPAFDRAWMAAILSVQVCGGIFLGFAAQFLLAWILLFHIMPLVGPNLLDRARDVAAFDAPARIGAQFMGVW